MKKLLLLLAILPLMISCQNSNYKYSDTETEQFLNEITKNAKISITDITEIKNIENEKVFSTILQLFFINIYF